MLEQTICCSQADKMPCDKKPDNEKLGSSGVAKLIACSILVLGLSFDSVVYAVQQEPAKIERFTPHPLSTDKQPPSIAGQRKLEGSLVKIGLDSQLANQLADAICQQNWRAISEMIVKEKQPSILIQRLGAISYLAPGSNIEGRKPFPQCEKNCIEQYESVSSLVFNQFCPILSIVRADSLLFSENLEAAEKILRDVIGNKNSSIEVKGVALNMLAVLADLKDEPTEALKFFLQAKKTPEYFEPDFNQALLYINRVMSGPEEISKLLIKVYENDPFFAYWHPSEKVRAELLEDESGAKILIFVNGIIKVLAGIVNAGGNVFKLVKGLNLTSDTPCNPKADKTDCKIFTKHYMAKGE